MFVPVGRKHVSVQKPGGGGGGAEKVVWKTKHQTYKVGLMGVEMK
jgi:hypothetical protein